MTNELDLVVKYAGYKGGGNGQLIIDDVELDESRDNRPRHGIGNEDPQRIEEGNKEYTFSTTTFMDENAADALKAIESGDAKQKAVYIKDDGAWEGRSDGMAFNTLTVSASDDGDTTVQIDADLLGVDWE